MAVVINVYGKANLEQIEKAEKQLAGMKSEAGAAAKPMSRLGSVVSSTGAKIAAGFAAAGVGAFMRSSINAASDLAESTSKMRVVFGEATPAVEKFASTAAESMGLSRQAAIEATGTYGNLFTSMGIGAQKSAEMSTSMVQLAADFASFNNIPVADALDAIRSGLVGEQEPLRRLGVNINEATLKAKALELGLSDGKETLSASAKAQAAYALMLEQSKNAQGDFARTSDGLANRQRILSARFTDMKATLGEALVPAMTALVGVGSSALGMFMELPGPVRTGAVVVAALGAAAAIATPFLSGFGSAVKVAGGAAAKAAGGLRNFYTGMTNARAGSSAFATPMMKLGGAVRSAAAGFAGFAKSLAQTAAQLVISTARTVANTAATIASRAASIAASAASKAWAAAQWLLNAALTANPIGLVVAAIAALVAAIVIAWKKSETFRKVVIGAWNAIKAATVAVFNGIVSFFKTWGPRILAVLAGPIGIVAALVIKHWDRIKEGASRAFGAVLTFARELPGKIKRAVGGLGRTLYGAGADLLRGLWEGMQSIAGWLKDKILTFFSDLLPGWAKKALGISSPSKVFAEIGRYAGAGLAAGMDSTRAIVAAAAAGLAGAAAGGAEGSLGSLALAGAGGSGRGSVVVAPGAVVVRIEGSVAGTPAELEGAVRSGVEPALVALAREISHR